MENDVLKIEKKGRSLWFTVCGDVDHHTSKKIRQQIDSEIFVTSPKDVFLDLSKVDFMDSSGLGLILGRYQIATELGIAFSVYEPCDAVMRLLKLSGCEKILNIIKKKA